MRLWRQVKRRASRETRLKVLRELYRSRGDTLQPTAARMARVYEKSSRHLDAALEELYRLGMVSRTDAGAVIRWSITDKGEKELLIAELAKMANR